MKVKETQLIATATSPAAAGTVIGPVLTGLALSGGESYVIDAILTGATGGLLNVYLQRKVTANLWQDWISFTQVAAAAAAVTLTAVVTGQGNATMLALGGGTDSAASPLLVAGTVNNVTPGGDVRVVFVAAALTTAGASQQIIITPYTQSVGRLGVQF